VQAVEVRHSGAGAGTGVQTAGPGVSRRELRPARRKKREDRRPIQKSSCYPLDPNPTLDICRRRGHLLWPGIGSRFNIYRYIVMMTVPLYVDIRKCFGAGR
jgi:hypothetical protein